MGREMQQNWHLPTGFCLWILLVQRSSSDRGYFSLFKIHLSSLFRCFIGEGSTQPLMGRLLLLENCFLGVKGCCRGMRQISQGKHTPHSHAFSQRAPEGCYITKPFCFCTALADLGFSFLFTCFSSWTSWVKHIWGSRGTVRGKLLGSS